MCLPRLAWPLLDSPVGVGFMRSHFLLLLLFPLVAQAVDPIDERAHILKCLANLDVEDSPTVIVTNRDPKIQKNSMLLALDGVKPNGPPDGVILIVGEKTYSIKIPRDVAGFINRGLTIGYEIKTTVEIDGRPREILFSVIAPDPSLNWGEESGRPPLQTKIYMGAIGKNQPFNAPAELIPPTSASINSTLRAEILSSIRRTTDSADSGTVGAVAERIRACSHSADFEIAQAAADAIREMRRFFPQSAAELAEVNLDRFKSHDVEAPAKPGHAKAIARLHDIMYLGDPVLRQLMLLASPNWRERTEAEETLKQRCARARITTWPW